MSAECPDWERGESADKLQYVLLGIFEFHKFVTKNAKHHIIQHGDIKTWHGKIFERVVPLSYYAGNYRSDDPSKPCLRMDVGVQSNPGAPYARVPDLMREFFDQLRHYTVETEHYIGTGEASPIDKTRAVVQLVSFAVGRFIQIHPFVNGNGRMSRLLANYLLYRFGYPFLYRSSYDRPIQPEYSQASEACMGGDFRLMFQFILSCLAIP